MLSNISSRPRTIPSILLHLHLYPPILGRAPDVKRIIANVKLIQSLPGAKIQHISGLMTSLTILHQTFYSPDNLFQVLHVLLQMPRVVVFRSRSISAPQRAQLFEVQGNTLIKLLSTLMGLIQVTILSAP